MHCQGRSKLSFSHTRFEQLVSSKLSTRVGRDPSYLMYYMLKPQLVLGLDHWSSGQEFHIHRVHWLGQPVTVTCTQQDTPNCEIKRCKNMIRGDRPKPFLMIVILVTPKKERGTGVLSLYVSH